MPSFLVPPLEPNVCTSWTWLTPSQHGGWAFTEEECDMLVGYADTLPARPGLVVGAGEDRDTRDVEIRDVAPDSESLWAYEKLLSIAEANNDAHWRFDLSQLANVEVLRYEIGGHYVEHVDWCAGNQTRKLSIVVMLSEPDDYEGGDLVLRPDGRPVVAPRERGAVTIFPSWTLHGVTPVTAGVRRVATAWVQGPHPFR